MICTTEAVLDEGEYTKSDSEVNPTMLEACCYKVRLPTGQTRALIRPHYACPSVNVCLRPLLDDAVWLAQYARSSPSPSFVELDSQLGCTLPASRCASSSVAYYAFRLASSTILHAAFTRRVPPSLLKELGKVHEHWEQG